VDTTLFPSFLKIPKRKQNNIFLLFQIQTPQKYFQTKEVVCDLWYSGYDGGPTCKSVYEHPPTCSLLHCGACNLAFVLAHVGPSDVFLLLFIMFDNCSLLTFVTTYMHHSVTASVNFLSKRPPCLITAIY
jgi:hypothetical protein